MEGTVAGKVSRLKGLAFVVRDGVRNPLALDMDVLDGDVISTGDGGRIEMRLKDDTILTLGDKTTFAINDYDYQGDSGVAKFRLHTGAFKIVSGIIARINRIAFLVRTPVATIGIRGTEFWAAPHGSAVNAHPLSPQPSCQGRGKRLLSMIAAIATPFGNADGTVGWNELKRYRLAIWQSNLGSCGYEDRNAMSHSGLGVVRGGMEPVADKGGGGHSPFAKAFIAALRDNREFVLDGTQLFNKVRRPVMVAADQTPLYSDVKNAGHGGGDFLFVRKN
ncbi:MAG: FecR domain-containing protein [Proteobacteria bacterium]|nr:FecR domain-containing protein [Pseudomonadota bacterium]